MGRGGDEEDEEDAEVGEFGEVGEVGGEAKDTAVYRAAASGTGTRRKETGCVLAGSGEPLIDIGGGAVRCARSAAARLLGAPAAAGLSDSDALAPP